MAVRLLDRNGHSGEGIIDRSSDAQLAIDTAVSGRGLRQNDACDQFICLQLAVIVAFAGVEVAQWNHASLGGAGDLNLRVETQQGCWRVAGESSPTFRSTRRNMAEIAIFLNAEPTRLAPA